MSRPAIVVPWSVDYPWQADAAEAAAAAVLAAAYPAAVPDRVRLPATPGCGPRGYVRLVSPPAPPGDSSAAAS